MLLSLALFLPQQVTLSRTFALRQMAQTRIGKHPPSIPHPPLWGLAAPCLSTASLPPRWVLDLQCQGSRNILSALRKAVEVDFKDKEEQQSQGIYLFTGGIPDQDMVGEPRLGLPYPPGPPHLPLRGRLATSFSSMIFPSRRYHLEMLFKCRQRWSDLAPRGLRVCISNELPGD